MTDGVGFPRHTFLIKVFDMKRLNNALAKMSFIYLLLSTLIYIVVYMIKSITRLALGDAIKFTVMNGQIIPFSVLFSSFYLSDIEPI